MEPKDTENTEAELDFRSQLKAEKQVLNLSDVIKSVCDHKYGGIGICDSEDGKTCEECKYYKQTVL